MLPTAIRKLIDQAREQGASDVHICAGAPILFRIGKDLMPAREGMVTGELAERIASKLLSDAQMHAFRERLDYDLMVADAGGRYRVNLSHNDGAIGLVIRILPDRPKGIDELGLPPALHEFAALRKGLVLVTGSTSQGKTSTMSAIIHEVNHTLRRHVITIEDPIETVHQTAKSIVRQREVGRDTESFYMGLRAALRQDPDVIAIGEMRDYETIKIALTAAETGVLVLSTLHIISIDKMCERLLSYAPTEDQAHFRYLLAGALRAVVHQELIPSVDGGKRVACEVLIATDAVKNVIRTGESFMLRSLIDTGRRHGMITMHQSVNALLEDGSVLPEAARSLLAAY
jgi:twitching motility protein PilT